MSGQGALTVTPIQLAHAVGGLAMGGVLHTPYLVREKASPPPPRRVDLDPVVLSGILDGLYGVVNEEGGTAARSRIPR